jgi:hypothetical protein
VEREEAELKAEGTESTSKRIIELERELLLSRKESDNN